MNISTKRVNAGECGVSVFICSHEGGTGLWANKLRNNIPGGKVPLKLGLCWKRDPRTVTTLIVKIRGFGRVSSRNQAIPRS
jgi:hypothetical protein